MKRLRSIVAFATVSLAALLTFAPAAGAASLPRVASGARPGPPLLYERPPAAPELSNRAPFRARPLLVSGTDAYRSGEYLYQDYLFDDRGADTLEGSAGQRDSSANFSPTTGNVFYPSADRYAENAADLVEFRVKPTPTAVLYRVTLNTVKADNAAIVGIGIDTNRSGGSPVAWPGAAGVSSPGLDRFITAWGTGGRVYRRDPVTGTLVVDRSLDDGDVAIDRRTNQMTIRVPRAVMNPARAKWRLSVGAGLRSASNGFKRVRQGPASETEPGSGDPTEGAPGVFNLAFRFDEPLSNKPTPRYGANVGTGNWFETKQAVRLKRATPLSKPSTAGFHADVDFARLADGRNGAVHPPRANQARILSSSLDVHEGFRDRFPSYGGRLQPYFLRVPPTSKPGRPRGLTFSLHSLGATYTQYGVFSPTQLRQFGDERANLVATPLGRGANGWYIDEGEVDFFEVWRDVARNFALDSERVALTGYSMGGYGTYRLGVLYPDLFGRAFTTVGPPARGGWVPPAPPFDPESRRNTQDTNSNRLLENARWVPYLNWVTLMDQLVPYPGPRAQQRRFNRLGLRSQLWTYPGEHFTLAVRDAWDAAKEFLARSQVKRAPNRVNYALMPATFRGDLGLVHNHAYWVSGLRLRDRSGDPSRNPARGEIDAVSRAFGESPTPRVASVTSANGGSPAPSAVEGRRWSSIPAQARANSLFVGLTNLARATIDGPRARLDGRRRLRVEIESDGSSTVRLNMRLTPGARVRRTEGTPLPGSGPEVALDRGGATFRAAAGSRTYEIEPGG